MNKQQPLLVVDAGNLLFKKALSIAKSTDNTTALITAHGIIRAYKAMSYDAVAVSVKDLSAELDFFLQSKEESFPWVAANIYDRNNDLLFSPHIIKYAGDLTIGVIGLTGGAGTSTGDFVIGDWRKALQAEIRALEQSCDMLVVLSSLTVSENNEIQRDFNQIDIVVTADRKGKNIQPQVLQGSILVQSGGRGKYLGKLAVTWHDKGNWLTASSQSLTHGKSRLSSIDWQLSQLEQQQRVTNKDFSQKIARLQSYRQTISKQIALQEAELTKQETKPSKSYSSTFLPVKPHSSGDSIDIIVQDIKKNINAFNRYRHSGLRLDDPAVRLALQNDEITGSTSCLECHMKQGEFWKSTQHADAYATLSLQGQSFNLQCLPCHVTAGKVNTASTDSELLFLLSLSGDRQTIGCEVCHGPGKQHVLSSGEIPPVRLPPEETCTQCHTPDRDNNFDYQKKLALIACPAN